MADTRQTPAPGPGRVPWPPHAEDLRRALRGMAQLQAFSKAQVEDVLVAATIWTLMTNERELPKPGCSCPSCLLAQAVLDFWPEIREDIGPTWRPINQAPSPNPN